VTVSYKPKNSRHWRTVKTAVIRADRSGTFSVNVKMYSAGLVIITARGTNSHKSASAFVYVINKYGGHGGSWSIRSASYSAPLASKPAPESSTPGLAVAGLGVLGVAGCALITSKTTVRHRRKAKSVA
jgi:hypothetical protein